MTFSLGQCFLKLPANSGDRSAFALEKPKLVPKSDDFAVFCGVHRVHSAQLPMGTKREQNPGR
jgi:hypothetical protein